MTPQTIHSRAVRLLAIRLARNYKLTAELLARRGMVSRRQARNIIKTLQDEGAISPIGYDETQRAGRPRRMYGVAP